ncbi:MAG: GAD domain-containing protein, partial [Candidatus Micrarchaeaceae archaeon]
IKDGARVEIKGVQELESIDKFIENEIKRQQNLLEIKGKLIKANANVGNAENITPIFKNTNVDVIKYHTHDGAVLAFSLKGFKGILGFEINPNRRVGTEISDYAKMAGVHGIIHSDEDLSKYKFSKEELDSIKKQLKISESESFIIIAGKLDEVTNAAKLAIWRAEYLMKGIPKETRVAHDTENYTSKFMRPLPTGSRMYPETDVRPTSLTSEMRSNAEKNAPNIEKETKYINSKIKNKILAEQLILSPRFQLFKTIIDRSKADPEFVANVLIQKLTEMRRNGIDIDSIKDESIIEIFNLYAQEKITKQAVEEAIKICSKSNDSIDLILSKNNLLRIKGKELNALIEKTRKESKSPDNELRNKLMSKYRLNVDGSELNSVLNGAK